MIINPPRLLTIETPKRARSRCRQGRILMSNICLKNCHINSGHIYLHLPSHNSTALSPLCWAVHGPHDHVITGFRSRSCQFLIIARWMWAVGDSTSQWGCSQNTKEVHIYVSARCWGLSPLLHIYAYSWREGVKERTTFPVKCHLKWNSSLCPIQDSFIHAEDSSKRYWESLPAFVL